METNLPEIYKDGPIRYFKDETLQSQIDAVVARLDSEHKNGAWVAFDKNGAHLALVVRSPDDSKEFTVSFVRKWDGSWTGAADAIWKF